jgi:hypothetical protein
MHDHHLYIIFALLLLVFLLMPRTEGFIWDEVGTQPIHISTIPELTYIQGSVNSGTHFPSISKARNARK